MWVYTFENSAIQKKNFWNLKAVYFGFTFIFVNIANVLSWLFKMRYSVAFTFNFNDMYVLCIHNHPCWAHNRPTTYMV